MIIGITGRIANGKSTLSKTKKGLIIELDDISKEVFEMKKSEILKAFKNINKSILRKAVFSSNEALDKLEAIMHPEMKKILKQKLEVAKKNHKGDIYIVGALWKKFEFKKLCDKIIVVRKSKQEAWELLKKRNPEFTKKEFEFVWNRQKECFLDKN